MGVYMGGNAKPGPAGTFPPAPVWLYALGFCGADRGTRTRDLLFTKQLLYQLS